MVAILDINLSGRKSFPVAATTLENDRLRAAITCKQAASIPIAAAKKF
jgi:hypothetical protein